MREQRAAMEKELGNMQAKAQGSYQELQAMQIKVKQLCLHYKNDHRSHIFDCFVERVHPHCNM